MYICIYTRERGVLKGLGVHCVHIHTHTYTCTFTYPHTCTYTYIHTHIHIHIYKDLGCTVSSGLQPLAPSCAARALPACSPDRYFCFLFSSPVHYLLAPDRCFCCLLRTFSSSATPFPPIPTTLLTLCVLLAHSVLYPVLRAAVAGLDPTTCSSSQRIVSATRGCHINREGLEPLG